MEYIIVYEKVTTWLRHVVGVKADSQQEALTKIIDCYKEGDDIFSEDDMEIITSENMPETEESMTVSENGGVATIEVVDRTGQVIWDNA